MNCNMVSVVLVFSAAPSALLAASLSPPLNCNVVSVVFVSSAELSALPAAALQPAGAAGSF